MSFRQMHDTKNFDKLLKMAKDSGFRVVKKNNKVYVFHNDKSKGFRTCHPDQKGFHDLRRFLSKN